MLVECYYSIQQAVAVSLFKCIVDYIEEVGDGDALSGEIEIIRSGMES